jgi:tetratricopeptide (TPR) repeat protein
MKLLRTCLAGMVGLILIEGAGAQETNAQQTNAQEKGNGAMLDTLFDKLQTVTDPFAIQSVEAAIWEQWTMLPDPAQRQLMARGIAEMEQQELQSAVASFTKLIELAPDVSEGWNKRATVQWLLGNMTASIADICETIKREPRHFGAYSGLGMIRAQMNEPGRAAAAYLLAKKYNPHIVGLDAEIERLKALGGEVSDDPLGCSQHTASR